MKSARPSASFRRYYARVEISVRGLVEDGRARLMARDAHDLERGSAPVSVNGLVVWFRAADLARIVFAEWQPKRTRAPRRPVVAEREAA